MGYTHYWRAKPGGTQEEWTVAVVKAAEVVRAIDTLYDIHLAGPFGEGPIKLDDDGIAFNGRGDEYTPGWWEGGLWKGEGPTRKRRDGDPDDEHETFLVPSRFEDLESFQFCKTARKPYDLAVVATLATLKHYAPNCITLNSDGDREDWITGVQCASAILNEPIENPIVDDVEEED